MKVYNNIILTLLLFMSLSVLSNDSNRFKHMKEKKIHKEFDYSEGMLLKVNNSYGNIDITAWDGDKIIVDALVIVKGKTESEVNELLKKVDIVFSDNRQEGILTFLTRKRTYKYQDYREIHYQIKVPKTCNLDIDNNYGDISIDESNAVTSLKTYYGNIKAGKLTGRTTLETSFSQHNTIDYLMTGKIKGQFCDYKIKEAGELEITEMISSNGIINTVNWLNYNCNYGSLTIENLEGKVEGIGEYVTVNIDKSNAKLVKLEAYYGYIDININPINNKFLYSFDLNNAKLILKHQKNQSFDFLINSKGETKDSNISMLPTDFIYKKHGTINSSNEILGYHNLPDTENRILISIKNGMFKFKEIELPTSSKQ